MRACFNVCKLSNKQTQIATDWTAAFGVGDRVKCDNSTYFVANSMFFLWTCSFGSEC